MNSRRLHTLMLAGLAVLALALVGGAYGADKLMGSQAAKLVSAKAKSQALDQEQISLNRAKKDIRTYSALNKIAQSVVPQDKNQAEAIREIVNIAANNGVILASITFPASTLGSLPAGTAAGTTGTAAPAPSPSGKSAGLSQLTPVKNIPGVYQLPITIKGDTDHPVQYDRFINFLSDLEHNRRTAQVASITIQPDSNDSSSVTFELTLNEYIKP